MNNICEDFAQSMLIYDDIENNNTDNNNYYDDTITLCKNGDDYNANIN